MKKAAGIIMMMFILLQTSLSAQENDQTLKEITLPPFTGIDAGSLSSIYLTSGSVQSVKMEKDAEEDDQNITFSVENSILKISGSNNSLTNSKIYICCPNLSYIKASGVSKVKSLSKLKINDLLIIASGASKIEMDIDVKKLTTDISGASKLTLKGNGGQHIANLNGATKLNADEIVFIDMEIQGSGVAKANVNVKSKLTGDMSGLSFVKYEKKPDTILLKSAVTSVEYANDSVTLSKENSADDTTKVSVLGSDIEVIDGKETKISIGNTEMTVEDNGKIKIGKKDKNKTYTHRFRGHWAGFELAFNGYVNKDFGSALPAKYDFLKLNDVKSIGVNLNVFELNANIINNRFGIVSGIGLQWNNYRFDDNVVLVPDSSTIYGYHNTSINSYIKSKLVESWVRVPLFLEYQTAQKKWKQFHFAVGGVFGYKIGSHSKQVHFADGDRNKPKVYNDFYLNPIKLDAEVRVGWGPINLFASYALTQMFKENKGPELYPYTVGITLASW